MTAPLFRCRGARIEVKGQVLLDELDIDVDGARVVLIGNFEPLFRLWSREATLTRGSVEVLGASAHAALRDNRLGIARVDAPYVRSSKAIESLRDSARLTGLGKREATRRAEVTLEDLGLGTLGRQRLGALDDADRRALAIARAVLGAPPAIAIERPFEALPDERALAVETALAKAAAGRQLLLNLAAPARSGPEARALEAASGVATLRSGVIVRSSDALPLDSAPGKLDS